MSAPDDECEACGHERAGMSLYRFGGKSGSLVYYLCPACSRRISNDSELALDAFDAYLAEREYVRELDRGGEGLPRFNTKSLRETALDGMDRYLDAIEDEVRYIGKME